MRARVNGRRPPERDRGDAPGDEESEPFIPCLAGVRESALLQVSSFDSGSGQYPEETESVGSVAMISCLLEGGDQRLEVAADLRMLAFAPGLDPNGHESELGFAVDERSAAVICLGSGLLEQCFCFGEPPRLLERLAQIQLERGSGVVVRREQRRRASEE